jgi:hypothetical protein
MTSCTPLPVSYPVPEQRPITHGPEPEGLSSFLTFDNPRTAAHIISDILDAPPGQSWRWTGQNPALKLKIESTGNLRFRARGAFPHQSHQPLVPITLSVFLNDKLLDRAAYNAAGDFVFQKDVSPELLLENGENKVRLELDKVYIAADGVKLGMILAELGFEKRK